MLSSLELLYSFYLQLVDIFLKLIVFLIFEEVEIDGWVDWDVGFVCKVGIVGLGSVVFPFDMVFIFPFGFVEFDIFGNSFADFFDYLSVGGVDGTDFEMVDL